MDKQEGVIAISGSIKSDKNSILSLAEENLSVAILLNLIIEKFVSTKPYRRFVPPISIHI
jgi:hypothetical protein